MQLVNKVPAQDIRNNDAGFFLGALLLVALLFLLLYYGLLYLREGTSSSQFNIPERIDVNINQP